MSKRILFLGASLASINTIKAAKDMGLHVIVADANGEAPGMPLADKPLVLNITDPEAVLETARAEEVDGIITLTDFGVVPAAYAAETLGLPGIGTEVAELTTSKLSMRQRWQERGLSTIRYARAQGYDGFLKAVDEVGLPAIVKPCNSKGGGSRGVRLLDENTDLTEAYEFSNSFYRDDDLLVEQYVIGLEHSAEVIVHKGKSHVIAISDKVKSPLPYRVDDTILYPTVEEGEQLEVVHKTIAASIEALGLTEGIAHVELSMTDDGPVLFELSARCGGGAPDPLVPYLSGVEESKEAIRIALGEAPHKLAPTENRGCVIKFVYPEPGVIDSIEVKDGADSWDGVLFFGLFAGVGDDVRPLRTCGDRTGMVIAGGKDREAALKLAERVIDSVIVKTTPK